LTTKLLPRAGLKFPTLGKWGIQIPHWAKIPHRIPRWGVYLPRKIPDPCKIAHLGRKKCPADSAPAEMASQSVTCDTSEPAATVLLPAQGEITIGWNNDGDMILRQSDWPNEDAVIIIARDYLWMFVDRLTDACGIPTVKG
jgi:hypothetical protein